MYGCIMHVKMLYTNYLGKVHIDRQVNREIIGIRNSHKVKKTDSCATLGMPMSSDFGFTFGYSIKFNLKFFFDECIV